MLFLVNSEDESDDVYHGTGCRNFSHCQQRYYDHPGDHAQSTFETRFWNDSCVQTEARLPVAVRKTSQSSSTGDIIKTVAFCSSLFWRGILLFNVFLSVIMVTFAWLSSLGSFFVLSAATLACDAASGIYQCLVFCVSVLQTKLEASSRLIPKGVWEQTS